APASMASLRWAGAQASWLVPRGTHGQSRMPQTPQAPQQLGSPGRANRAERVAAGGKERKVRQASGKKRKVRANRVCPTLVANRSTSSRSVWAPTPPLSRTWPGRPKTGATI
ncbi:unnamed protein product, partial [Polarella glacialis]